MGRWMAIKKTDVFRGEGRQRPADVAGVLKMDFGPVKLILICYLLVEPPLT